MEFGAVPGGDPALDMVTAAGLGVVAATEDDIGVHIAIACLGLDLGHGIGGDVIRIPGVLRRCPATAGDR